MHKIPMKMWAGALAVMGMLQISWFQGTAWAQDENAGDESVEESSDSGESSVSDEQSRAVVHETPTVAEPTVMTDALLDKQLREVSTNVDTLKEDTFTTKSRLLLLREEVLQRSVGGARLQLRHKYDMGGQYNPIQILYAVDQEVVYARQDTSGSLSELDDQVIFDRMVAPGPHQLTVLYVYKGRPWGVFRYMTDYTFRVESGYEFTVDEGKAAELVISAMERGNFFTAYEKRPSVRYDYHQYELTPQTAELSEAE